MEWLQNPILITPSPPDTSLSFPSLSEKVRASFIAALNDMGVDELLPVQVATLTHFKGATTTSTTSNYRGGDLCVCAPTGSGKTLSYLLPLLVALAPRNVVRLRAIIVLPGRELAQQVVDVLLPLAKALSLHVGVSIGGSGSNGFDRLKGIDILVCTPGRLMDIVDSINTTTTSTTTDTPNSASEPTVTQTSTNELGFVEFLVFDEADRLLEGGSSLQSAAHEWFHPLLNTITKKQEGVWRTSAVLDHSPPSLSPMWCTPLTKILCSATLTRNPAKLSQLKLRDPCYMIAGGAGGDGERINLPPNLEHHMWVGPLEQKVVALLYILKHKKGPFILFCRSIEQTERLNALLKSSALGLQHLSIRTFSSSISGEQRAEVLRGFGQEGGVAAAAAVVDLLICSDAAARGLDLDGAQGIINYDAPKWAKSYCHRVGRVARQGRHGTAYTLVEIKEAHHFKLMFEEELDSSAVLQKLKIPMPLLKEYKAALLSNVE